MKVDFCLSFSFLSLFLSKLGATAAQDENEIQSLSNNIQLLKFSVAYHAVHSEQLANEMEDSAKRHGKELQKLKDRLKMFNDTIASFESVLNVSFSSKSPEEKKKISDAVAKMVEFGDITGALENIKSAHYLAFSVNLAGSLVVLLIPVSVVAVYLAINRRIARFEEIIADENRKQKSSVRNRYTVYDENFYVSVP